MEHWQADIDRAMVKSGEDSALPDSKPDQMCDICGRFFYKLYLCAGCGQINGCKSCMYFDEETLKYYCDPESMPERDDV